MSFPADFLRAFALLLLALGLAGCSTTRPWSNPPLAADEPIRYDGLAQLFDRSRSPDMLVVANFSGGGSRAAAFAHAVLDELDRRRLVSRGRETSLTREIDMVTGVSGGSVAAAHLALHGAPTHLQRFPADFLERDFQSLVVGAVLSPVNLHRASSPWFGRGNVLAEAFDDVLFDGATFGSLAAQTERPYLIVGATDLATGAEFNFTSDRLRLLCSSIDRVPLAFAVAASSAVPVLFSPLTLHNHGESCPHASDAIASRPVQQGDSARVRLVKSESASIAAGKRRYIHLVDGGVSDNLGTRRLTDYVAKSGGVAEVLTMLGAGPSGGTVAPRRIVFISVNSEGSRELPMDGSDRVPGAFEVVNALVYGGLGRFSRETSLVFGDAVAQWRDELRRDPRFAADAERTLQSLDFRLEDVDDPVLRAQVLAIPTAFRISPSDRALLREAAQRLVSRSEALARFIATTPPD